jgi:pilus assembly protein CpaE
VLVIGENADISFYRTLIYDLGVTEYLWKPLTRDNVARLFGPRIAGTAVGPVTERGGRIVVLCGARGGVGTTTVTVNTAMQLADTTRTHVALLDLHLQGGTVALMLGANPGPGLRIALESPERADSLFLDRVSIPVNDRLRLIAADEALEAILSPTPAGVTHVVELLKQKFNYVLVDLPMPPAPAMRGLLALARQTIIVMGPDVASVRDAQAIRRFVAAEAGADRALTVLNRADIPGALTSSLIEKGLGRKPDAVIPDLGRPLLKAANLGTPAIHKSAALRKALAPIVREIAAVHDAPVQRSWLSRLMSK